MADTNPITGDRQGPRPCEHGAAGCVAALSREVPIRVLNCDPRGCLIESSTPLPVGAVVTLHIELAGQMMCDAAQVVRCQQLRGSGSVFHLAMCFLPTTPAYEGSLRHGIRHELSGQLLLAGAEFGRV
jgi:hypothetical protein